VSPAAPAARACFPIVFAASVVVFLMPSLKLLDLTLVGRYLGLIVVFISSGVLL
jgi:hypothetical protein